MASAEILTLAPDSGDRRSAIERSAGQAVEQARAFTVVTDEDYARGVEAAQHVKRAREDWKQLAGRSVEAARVALDEAREMFKRVDTPLAQAYVVLKTKLADHVERRREEHQRALAEARRVQAESEALAVAQAKVAQQAAQAAVDAERGRLYDAAVMAGDEAKAERILATADTSVPLTVAVPPPPPVPPAAQPLTKAKGAAVGDTYTFEIVDASALPREYLMPDQSAIRRVVQALKDRTSIPGVVVRRSADVRIRKS